jgi:hypothetical protein
MTQRAAGRSQPRGPQSRRDQLVIVVSIVTLVAAVLIVLAGVYVTRYRPPRAHVLSVGQEQFNAADAERRLRYLLLFESDKAGTDVEAVVDTTLDVLEREQVLRERASALVGDVSANDVEQELRTQLAPAAPTVTVSGGSTATPTPVSDEAYATALQQRLQQSGLSKEDLEAIARAHVFEKRLLEHFKAALPTQAAQVHLAVARLNEQAKADQVRAIVTRPGVEFGPVASGNSVSTGGTTGDLDWVLIEDLDQVVREAVQTLKAGDVSPVVKNGDYFEVYKLVEAPADRDLTEEQRETLATKRVDEWVEAERKHVQIARGMSESEESWIRDHALQAYAREVGQVR